MDICMLYCYIVMGRGVTYMTDFGLDDWIYCASYIHTVWDYRQLQRYHYSSPSPVHRYTRTRILSLH
jgi:hypothetical protein